MFSSLQVLILGNQFAADPDEEDSENILRVIALKNYCANTEVKVRKVKVLVQILQYYNTVRPYLICEISKRDFL